MVFVNKFNTAHPVTVIIVITSLYIILPAGKIPHKVPEIHVAKLVLEHELHVVTKRWFFYYKVTAIVSKEFVVIVKVKFSFLIRSLKLVDYILKFITYLRHRLPYFLVAHLV